MRKIKNILSVRFYRQALILGFGVLVPLFVLFQNCGRMQVLPDQIQNSEPLDLGQFNSESANTFTASGSTGNTSGFAASYSKYLNVRGVCECVLSVGIPATANKAAYSVKTALVQSMTFSKCEALELDLIRRSTIALDAQTVGSNEFVRCSYDCMNWVIGEEFPTSQNMQYALGINNNAGTTSAAAGQVIEFIKLHEQRCENLKNIPDATKLCKVCRGPKKGSCQETEYVQAQDQRECLKICDRVDSGMKSYWSKGFQVCSYEGKWITDGTQPTAPPSQPPLEPSPPNNPPGPVAQPAVAYACSACVNPANGGCESINKTYTATDWQCLEHCRSADPKMDSYLEQKWNACFFNKQPLKLPLSGSGSGGEPEPWNPDPPSPPTSPPMQEYFHPPPYSGSDY